MPASSGDVDALIPSLEALAEILRDDPQMCKDPRLAPILASLSASATAGEALPEAPPASPVRATDASALSAGAVSPPAATAAAESPAAPATSGPGCYLVATEEQQGTLFAWWSETPVEGAIAFMKPRKNVPKFKYNQRGGKNELVRGMRGPLVKNYYRGWCDFIKNYVKAFDGSLILYPPPGVFPAGTLDVGVFLSMENLSVKKLKPNEEIGTVCGVRAVCAADPSLSMFDSISSMATAMFLDKGNNAGASMSLQ